MKNSLMPLALVLLTVCGAVLWLASSPTSDPGVEGPRLVPGIFRLPKDQRKLVPSAELERSEVTVSQPVPTPFGDASTWSIVVVRADDRRPITASVVLGLAETLSQRGCVAVIAPDDAALLPLGAERVLAVSAPETSRLSDPVAETTVQVTVRDQVLRLPIDHPAAARQPDGFAAPASAATASLIHCSTVPANSTVTWSGRYAAIGRALATSALQAFGCPTAMTQAPQLADWKALLHLPPQYDGARWYGAFQRELVRGWIGETTVETAAMETRMKNGQWHAEPAAATGWSLWSKDLSTDQGTITRWFSRRGEQIVCWEERPGTVAVIEELVKNAALPDAKLRADAVARLQSYRNCPVLSAELRARMTAALEAKP